MIAYITLLTNGHTAERWRLDEGEVFRIGRAEDNHARPKTRGLSRYHTELVFRDGAWFVKDLGSTNGSYVNGERVPPNSESPLESGDRLAIGGGRFLFETRTPRLAACPICGEGMLFDEKAVLANGAARERVLLCVRCGTAIEETEEGNFLPLFVPELFAQRLREIRSGPLTLDDMEEISRDAVASLDLGPVDDEDLEELSDVFTAVGGEEEEELESEAGGDDEAMGEGMEEDISKYVRHQPLFDDDLPVAATGHEESETPTAGKGSDAPPDAPGKPSLDDTVNSRRTVESPVMAALEVIEEAEQREETEEG